VITLGQTGSDKINRMITITDEIYLLIFSTVNGILKCDHIKRLITLTSDCNKWPSLYLVIKLSPGEYSIMIENVLISGEL